MILIADSGSTKTDWCVVDNGQETVRLSTQGINPFQQERDVIENIVRSAFHGEESVRNHVTEVYFYGAGCREEMRSMMTDILMSVFPHAVLAEVNGDLLAAARALCGNSAGIACILGTGANSCLYDGERITANIPPLGYVLGDEGSGAVLGRNFINALYKDRLPASLREAFTAETGLTMADVIRKVYREPMANRFLASFSLFIHSHIDGCDELQSLVIDNFRAFFRNNICRYKDAVRGDESPLTINAIGSMAYYYRRELSAAAALEGFRIGKVERSPMAGLVAFHSR